jgi:hypothetical protein
MFTKKLFPIARSKKDWHAVSKKLDIAFALMDDLQDLNYDSDEYDFEKFETKVGRVVGLVDAARTIANCYE